MDQLEAMDHAIDNRILHALFCMSRENLPIDATRLGRAVGQSPSATAAALLRLERAGLVDASRARLTMLGLARAVAIGSELGGSGVDLGAARVAEAPHEPLAAAAGASVAPPAPAVGGGVGDPQPRDAARPTPNSEPPADVEARGLLQ